MAGGGEQIDPGIWEGDEGRKRTEVQLGFWDLFSLLLMAVLENYLFICLFV